MIESLIHDLLLLLCSHLLGLGVFVSDVNVV